MNGSIIPAPVAFMPQKKKSRSQWIFDVQINELPKPEYMEQTLEELRIGTYSRIHTVRESTTIIEALKLFVEHRVSALPVVESSGSENFVLL